MNNDEKLALLHMENDKDAYAHLDANGFPLRKDMPVRVRRLEDGHFVTRDNRSFDEEQRAALIDKGFRVVDQWTVDTSLFEGMIMSYLFAEIEEIERA